MGATALCTPMARGGNSAHRKVIQDLLSRRVAAFISIGAHNQVFVQCALGIPALRKSVFALSIGLVSGSLFLPEHRYLGLIASSAVFTAVLSR